MSDSKFKIGDKVRIKPSSEYFIDGDSLNPKYEIGVVVETDTYNYVSVDWLAGANCYADHDLELALVPLKIATQPTQDLQSELTEALAKIDTLESALEDAVRELISLREGDNTAVIDVKEDEFTPIRAMTLEDWELAKEEEWLFSLSDGSTDSLNEIDYSDRRYPVGMKASGWKTLDGFNVYAVEYRKYGDVNITKRIK